MIDTHTHIYMDEFDADRVDVIERAKEAGVTKVILPNVDLSTIEQLEKMWAGYPSFCEVAMGLHPTSVDSDYLSALKNIEQLFTQNTYCAVGEIGVDLYWDRSHLKEQLKAFEIQLKWASEMDLPVIIHARDSFDEIISVIEKSGLSQCTGIFHSFTGTREHVERIKNCGNFMFGINGIVTFKNSGLRELLPFIGMDYIVLETDAPYLSPVPFRGKRNEPSHLTYICRAVADAFLSDESQIAYITTENAGKMFKKASF